MSLVGMLLAESLEKGGPGSGPSGGGGNLTNEQLAAIHAGSGGNIARANVLTARAKLAGKAADKMSKGKGSDQASYDAHMRASDAHAAAAVAQRSVGNNRQASAHERASEGHYYAADAHGGGNVKDYNEHNYNTGEDRDASKYPMATPEGDRAWSAKVSSGKK